jgi:isoquinoline 1-oxidoreductase alpha subunit
MQINLNGSVRTVDAPAQMPLLWVLRDRLNLTGTKFGCGHGVCGACIVSIDGAQEHACQVTCGDVAGKSITTIEGLSGPIGDALFAAWEQIDVSQCGFCQPAQLMSASVLLSHNKAPTDADIDEAMKHNLCRCATYARIRQAIHQAAVALSAAEGA